MKLVPDVHFPEQKGLKLNTVLDIEIRCKTDVYLISLLVSDLNGEHCIMDPAL